MGTNEEMMWRIDLKKCEWLWYEVVQFHVLVKSKCSICNAMR